jgi:hypothetical protein
VNYGVILHLSLGDVLAADVLLRSCINNHCVLDVTELDIDDDSLLEVSGGDAVRPGAQCSCGLQFALVKSLVPALMEV